MFKIIGADGKEYGPISLEQLRQWMNEGRIHSGTQVKPEGATCWQTLSSLPEFAGQAPPPPPPPSRRSLAAPDNSKMSVMAVISLVLGILGIFSCGVTALVGLVLGIVALLQIKNSDGRLTGRGIAIAGIITSAIFMLVLPFYAMVLSGMSKAKSRAQSILCINNVKQLSLAAHMYSMNNKDQFPTTNWCDLIQTNVGTARAFQCSLDPASRCGFAFNIKLSGKKTDEVNSQTVLFFESKAGWNAAGGTELMSSGHHDNGTTIIGFADGSVMKMTQLQLSKLRWDP